MSKDKPRVWTGVKRIVYEYSESGSSCTDFNSDNLRSVVEMSRVREFENEAGYQKKRADSLLEFTEKLKAKNKKLVLELERLINDVEIDEARNVKSWSFNFVRERILPFKKLLEELES